MYFDGGVHTHTLRRALLRCAGKSASCAGARCVNATSETLSYTQQRAAYV